MTATTQPEVLKPCPFCGGPPSPNIVKAEYPGGWLDVDQVDRENGTEAEAYVFCHECGAASAHVEDLVWDAETYHELIAMGVRQWQDRDQRHDDLYQAGVAEGLNLFPRPGEPSNG